MDINKIHLGDCLELMPNILSSSVDMILCDLPYGTTVCAWDTIIPFDKLWEQYERIIKPNGAIILTASQPFTSALIMSNIKLFRYCWIWDKVLHSNPFIAKKQPLNNYEDVCVFYKNQPTYNPQMWKGRLSMRGNFTHRGSETKGDSKLFSNAGKSDIKYPVRILTIPNSNKRNIIHPTQKPVPLFEYYIKTYTNEGDLVLDNCMGSGTTAIACMNLKRNFIGIEKDEKYFEMSNKRINDYNYNPKLF
jgi:site-specific DNA-methyltransferase (adenine-specific)